MNPQTELLLRELAEKLGVSIDHLWGVMVRQSYVNFFTQIILYVILVIYLFLVHKYVKHCVNRISEIAEYNAKRDRLKEYDTLRRDDFGYTTAIIVMSVTSLIFTVIGILCFPDVLGQLLNPEYYALKQLLDVVK